MPHLTITNPHQADLERPLIYCIKVQSPTRTYRYVGRASSKSRLSAYERNVARALEGLTKRPTVTRDGRAQSRVNQEYRHVHLVLIAAVKNGWPIAFYPLANCDRQDLARCEKAWSVELKADLNDGPAWPIDELDMRLSDIS